MPATHPSPNSELKTYEPDNVLKNGYAGIFKRSFSEIARNRWLIWQLCKRDFIAQYRQSFVGVFWTIIIPLLSAGTFAVLNRSGIFKFAAVLVPYPLFAIFGLMNWQIFSTGLLHSSEALVKAGNMIVKINVSKKSLVIAAFLQSFVAFLVQFVLLLALYLLYGLLPSPRMILLPILLAPLVFMTLGLGLILSILNSIMRDIAKLVSFIMTFILFLTPVLYVKPGRGLLATVSRFNPLYHLVCFPRNYILLGDRTDLYGYLGWSLLAIVAFFFFLFVFHLAETRISERI
jgi:lipopolysaccharide transport system permease protein